jgi:Zn-dependent peptidase ImmA (M78 family)
MSDYPTTLHEQINVIKHHQALDGVPPIHVIPITKDLGIPVYKAHGWDDDTSGMIKLGKDGYEIYVNAGHHPHRRRFTIAHELAHFILHKDYIGNGIVDDALLRSRLSNKIEKQADSLAADILMPMNLLCPMLGSGPPDVERLAELFWVSKQAMSIRLSTTQDVINPQHQCECKPNRVAECA